ncbi:MAG TPA: lipocalin-like domain-containing protein [Bryobacteraceae bacterium]|nr:lipocalin-like domain-containing protein [Bryobacteraceae bacterium]
MTCSVRGWLKRIAVIVSLAVLPSTRGAFAADSPLAGAWQLDSGQSGQAGLYLFTSTRYSMMLASTTRPDIADTSKATADELRALWNPMLANSGSYEVSGDLITIHPLVAKIPVVMKPGATEVYRFRIEGKTLTLKQVRNARGVAVEQSPTFTFVRVE